ncbi:LysR family transcriptional regulator [Rhodobacteraceae bacterium D3-12]|nr:LysR family transcriptional regulator [Rhodobacteraceae bacterium D3-12]
MQVKTPSDLNWNDLRFLLALSRAHTLVGAARHLGVDETTVSRRLRALEQATGLVLLQPGVGRAITLTPAAHRLADIATAMEGESRALNALVSDHSGTPTGRIRLTATPMIVNRLIAPALPEFAAAHPGLSLALLPDGRDYDLARHEADLALRLARPSHGGQTLTTRRIARLTYAAFAPVGGDPETLPWITLDPALSHLPHARWLAAQTPQARVTVSDVETARAAVVAGLGKTLLPCLPDQPSHPAAPPTLTPIAANTGTPPPSRDIWLLRRRADRRDPATQAVAQWLETLCATLPSTPTL